MDFDALLLYDDTSRATPPLLVGGHTVMWRKEGQRMVERLPLPVPLTEALVRQMLDTVERRPEEVVGLVDIAVHRQWPYSTRAEHQC
jgi:hypothetical protein